MAGTGDGSIYLWESLTQLEPLQLGRPLDDPPYFDRVIASKVVTDLVFDTPVSCLAATDEIVVNGFDSGALRIVRFNGNGESACVFPPPGSPRELSYGPLGEQPNEEDPLESIPPHSFDAYWKGKSALRLRISSRATLRTK